MKTLITVREYARLTTSTVDCPTLDLAQVTPSAFDWLCKLNASFTKAGAAIIHVQDRCLLKLDNHVGILETPCGTRLEILPKHFEQGDCVQQSRALLRRMIQKTLKLPTREVGAATLQPFDAPLSEWIMGRFLEALDHLIKRGLRFDYHRVEEEQRFLRGQLNVSRQIRQPAGRQHHFQIRHDVFLPDRAENRLLKTALDVVCKSTQSPESWRFSHELRSILVDIPSSQSIQQDFKQWQQDRLMAHYQPIKPWCELIIQQQMPLAVAGDWNGMSLLFPMERLFENYVAGCLESALLPGAVLRTQVASKFLCMHEAKPVFGLKPDLLIEHGDKQWVLDTKWKRLDLASKNYGLSQSDFYQMFAYGHKYLGGRGELILIYPRFSKFQKVLPVFDYSSQLKVWVMPFDLEEGQLKCIEANLPLQGCQTHPDFL